MQISIETFCSFVSLLLVIFIPFFIHKKYYSKSWGHSYIVVILLILCDFSIVIFESMYSHWLVWWIFELKKSYIQQNIEWRFIYFLYFLLIIIFITKFIFLKKYIKNRRYIVISMLWSITLIIIFLSLTYISFSKFYI